MTGPFPVSVCGADSMHSLIANPQPGMLHRRGDGGSRCGGCHSSRRFCGTLCLNRPHCARALAPARQALPLQRGRLRLAHGPVWPLQQVRRIILGSMQAGCSPALVRCREPCTQIWKIAGGDSHELVILLILTCPACGAAALGTVHQGLAGAVAGRPSSTRPITPSSCSSSRQAAETAASTCSCT